MAQFSTLDDVDVSNKTVLVRADLNLPMQDGKVTDATRVTRLLPTIKELVKDGAKIILMSHFGRPKGTSVEEYSLKHLLPTLSNVFGQPVLFANDCVGPEATRMAKDLQPGQILLLENLRFHGEEEKNDPAFAKALASLADIYVNDAFSCSHRAHSSVVAITQFLPSFVGRGMQAEMEALSRILDHPKRPLMAIVAGSKISTKLDLLKSLVQKVDKLAIGGGMANTFLSASDCPIGQSINEPEMLDTARAIVTDSYEYECDLILPEDVAVTSDIKADTPRRVVQVMDVQGSDKIVDIGQNTIAEIRSQLATSGTVVWNGPVGIFEIPPFDVGTVEIAKCIAEFTKNGTLISVAGGGDTLAALAHAGCSDAFTYTSTAGGAFLEWLEGKTLPGVEALETGERY
ncbi:MAG: phosphoglycerate kinase [Alphaproteobacteria bacterium]|jgi:phosphoglycerate kinase|nr:phosphoglycerate kinase [Alphaproteobacteria bacterium]